MRRLKASVPSLTKSNRLANAALAALGGHNLPKTRATRKRPENRLFSSQGASASNKPTAGAVCHPQRDNDFGNCEASGDSEGRIVDSNVDFREGHNPCSSCQMQLILHEQEQLGYQDKR